MKLGPFQAPVEAPAMGLPPVASLLAITGKACYVPLKNNGTVINSCVEIHGQDVPVCWVRNIGWEVRALLNIARDISNCMLLETISFWFDVIDHVPRQALMSVLCSIGLHDELPSHGSWSRCSSKRPSAPRLHPNQECHSRHREQPVMCSALCCQRKRL